MVTTCPRPSVAPAVPTTTQANSRDMSNEATPRARPTQAQLAARSSTMSSVPGSPLSARSTASSATSSPRKKSVNLSAALRASGKATNSSAAATVASKKIAVSRPLASSMNGSRATPPTSNLPLLSSTRPGADARAPTKISMPTAKRTNGVPPLPKMATGDNEPLKAFLRIRPAPQQADDAKQVEEPYIEVVNNTEVLMNPPKDGSAPRARIHATAVPTKFTFSRVFPGAEANATAEVSSRAQADFFQNTTLPLVDELLQGQSGLIFTYGVTNSGKSYTVQGGAGAGEAGILPRSVDVIFNSIQGLESTSDIRPVGLAGVERASATSPTLPDAGVNPFSLPGISKKLATDSSPTTQYEHDVDTKVRVDRNYRYSVWVSYVEVYNEKIFDLLDAAPPAPGGMTASASSFGMSRSDSVRGSNWALASLINGSSSSSSSNSNNGDGQIYLQRKPLSLKNDIEAGGKYVAGLREIRIHSSVEARELMRRGQENRRVFATMANRASSRSHGVFTVKVIREHAGEDDWSVACSTSRLSIVDLAGSERLSNTSASGDRLKEAGSINKSLMCLGQCIETLRKNQARAASFIPAPITPLSSASGSGVASVLPRVLKRRPSIVPFRHSKLTELFQSFFTGEGRAVMIVNVNPYDTGFDENSHVMRFSAAAKEVHTVRTQAQATNLSRFVHPSLRNLFNGQPSTPSKRGTESPSCPPTPKATAMAAPPTPSQRSFAVEKQTAQGPAKVTPALQAVTRNDRSVQAVLSRDEESCEVTIIEASDDEDGDQSDPFVEHLMQKYEEMRQALFESEMRCATIEREVREEMADEMAEQLAEMERVYNERMLADAAHNEDFVNRKLDLMARASGYGGANVERAEDESMDDDALEVEGTLGSAIVRDRSSADSADCSCSTVSTAVEDASVVVASSNRRSSRARRVISDDEEESDDDVDESRDVSLAANESKFSQEPTSMFEDSSSISMDVPPSMIAGEASGADEAEADEDEESDNTVDTTQDESQADDSRVSSVSRKEDTEEENEVESEEEDEEDSEEETSDESFDVTEESIESSFEAAPRARRSTLAKKAVNSRASAAASSTRQASAKVAATVNASNRRRTTTAAAPSSKSRPAPLSDSSAANKSLDLDSDASLVIVKDDTLKKKSPKKRLLGRKTIMDEETMLEQIGDSSLVDELQRRIS